MALKPEHRGSRKSAQVALSTGRDGRRPSVSEDSYRSLKAWIQCFRSIMKCV